MDLKITFSKILSYQARERERERERERDEMCQVVA